MPESLRSRCHRWLFNWFPAYRGTGGRITFIASDWREVRVRLPLNWRTRNYVGTIFGGSMYGAIDPIYMIMLIKSLGPRYLVWDKAATIRFRKPGREPLFAVFQISAVELDAIAAGVDRFGKIDREYAVELTSASGEIHASCQKIISIRRRDQEAPASATR